MNNNPEIELITNCIIREYQPDKIILFGSWAQGDAKKQSDIDLLVISDREKRLPRYKRGLDIRLLLSQSQSPCRTDSAHLIVNIARLYKQIANRPYWKQEIRQDLRDYFIL